MFTNELLCNIVPFLKSFGSYLAITINCQFLTARRHFGTEFAVIMSLQKLAHKLSFTVHFIGVVVTNSVTVTSVLKD